MTRELQTNSSALQHNNTYKKYIQYIQNITVQTTIDSSYIPRSPSLGHFWPSGPGAV
jgi:hypothetical protein